MRVTRKKNLLRGPLLQHGGAIRRVSPLSLHRSLEGADCQWCNRCKTVGHTRNLGFELIIRNDAGDEAEAE